MGTGVMELEVVEEIGRELGDDCVIRGFEEKPASLETL